MVKQNWIKLAVIVLLIVMVAMLSGCLFGNPKPDPLKPTRKQAKQAVKNAERLKMKVPNPLQQSPKGDGFKHF